MAYTMQSQAFVPQGSTVAPLGNNPSGLLAMPDFDYRYDASKGLGAKTVLSDYYSNLGNKYLPELDTWASSNAGKMVTYDPDKFMTAADFGWDDARSNLRGAAIKTDSVGGKTVDDFSAFYRKGVDSEGMLTLTPLVPQGDSWAAVTPSEGEKLFNAKGVSVGAYHKSTDQEAADAVFKNGGASAQGSDEADVMGNGSDFLNNRRLTMATESDKTKWGADFADVPELKPYLDNPDWVTKVDGKVTAVRAELLPYVMRQAISSELYDMNRGLAKESGGIGRVIGAIALSVLTMGVGTMAAGALGMTAPVGGAAAATGAAGASAALGGAGLTMGGSMVAGAVGGGLSAAMTGGDVLKGAAFGGLGGAAGNVVSKTVGNVGGKMFAAATPTTRATIGNALATGAITGAGKAALTGGDAGKAAITSGVSAGVLNLLPQTSNQYVNTALNSVVGNTVSQYMANLLADSPTISTTPTTPTTPATARAMNSRPASQGRINYRV